MWLIRESTAALLISSQVELLLLSRLQACGQKWCVSLPTMSAVKLLKFHHLRFTCLLQLKRISELRSFLFLVTPLCLFNKPAHSYKVRLSVSLRVHIFIPITAFTQKGDYSFGGTILIPRCVQKKGGGKTSNGFSVQNEFRNSHRCVNKLTLAPSRISESIFLRWDSNLCEHKLWKRQIEIHIAKDLGEGIRILYHEAQLKRDVLISSALSCAWRLSYVAEDCEDV